MAKQGGNDANMHTFATLRMELPSFRPGLRMKWEPPGWREVWRPGWNQRANLQKQFRAGFATSALETSDEISALVPDWFRTARPGLGCPD